MQQIDYINNVILGPRSMVLLEYALAILFVLTYVITAKWMITTVISWLFNVHKHSADWFAYAVVVILTPIVLSYFWNYEITPFALMVFVSYTACWLWGKSYKHTLKLF